MSDQKYTPRLTLEIAAELFHQVLACEAHEPTPQGLRDCIRITLEMIDNELAQDGGDTCAGCGGPLVTVCENAYRTLTQTIAAKALATAVRDDPECKADNSLN